MATYTENYNLEKPAQSDLYNINVFNENADKIDEALGDKAENQSLAPIESSATASRNYSVGQQFVYNGLLYEATSAIASGGTITPGTNCARTTVAEELSALNDSLTYNQVQTGISGVDAYKMGHIVTLVFNLTNLSVSANAWNNVGTLPSALRPKQYLQSNGYDGRNNKAIEFNIQSTGLVRAYFFDANVYFRATITYISND